MNWTNYKEMESLKKITTDEFLEKFDNDTLENEDLRAVHFQRTFEDTDNSYWKEIERGEYYEVFKIVINNFLERYFTFTEGLIIIFSLGIYK